MKQGYEQKLRIIEESKELLIRKNHELQKTVETKNQKIGEL